MEATFVRLESLTYFSLSPIPLFGSGLCRVRYSQLEEMIHFNASFKRKFLKASGFFVCHFTDKIPN